MQKRKINKDNFYSQLWKIVFPVALQNLLSSVVSASDALMLGALDQQSLSAISLATQIQFVLGLFHATLVIGTTILAAQYWGKGDKEKVEDILAIVLRLSLIISVAFFAASFFFPHMLMRFFTNEQELILLGIPYLKIVSVSYLLSGVSQVYLCIMKNTGRVMRGTLYASSAVVLNLILNALLIFGWAGLPKLEIEGAAIATVIARTVEFVFIMFENAQKGVVKIRIRKLFNVDRKLQQDYIKYTLPVFFNEMAWGLGFTMFSVIIGHLGSDAVAANSIANIVKNIIACASVGIGSGSAILVGNALGCGDLELARRNGDRLCHVSVLTGIVSGIIIVICSPLILQFAGNLTPQAREYLKIMLWTCSYYMIGKSVNGTVIIGIFCAGADSRFGCICDIITMWVVCVPVGALAAFVFKWPVMVVYILLNMDEIVKLPAVYRHYKKYKWLKNLTNDEQIAEGISTL